MQYSDIGNGCYRSSGARSQLLGRLQRRRAAAGAQAVARDRKVSLMRKYRTGELPDVQQLSVAAFLGPLGTRPSLSGSTVCVNRSLRHCTEKTLGF